MRATVRSKTDADKVGHLERLAAALPGEGTCKSCMICQSCTNLHNAALS